MVTKIRHLAGVGGGGGVEGQGGRVGTIFNAYAVTTRMILHEDGQKRR